MFLSFKKGVVMKKLIKTKQRRWKREATIKTGGKIVGYIIAPRKKKVIVTLDKGKIETITLKHLPNKPCYTKSKAGHLYLIEDPDNYLYVVVRMANGDKFELELDGLEPEKTQKK
jgi:hypothetical protein